MGVWVGAWVWLGGWCVGGVSMNACGTYVCGVCECVGLEEKRG